MAKLKLIMGISLMLIPMIHFGQNWQPMDKGIDCFYHGQVREIVVDSLHEKLYVCGTFNQDGNCTPMRGMAIWNGIHWDSIGNATEGIIMKYGMGLFNDTLYMSGNFYNANAKTYFAKWNNSFWDTLPKSPNDVVITSLQKDNNLYIGGVFDHLGNDSTFLLGKYDGHQFSAMTPYYGAQGGYSVNSLVFFQDTLYVAGRFGLEPYKNYDTFAKWYNNDLHPTAPEFLGSVATSNIYAMAVYHNELYIGGYFRKADGYTGDYIMKWDGHQLSEAGTGMDDIVTCMKVHNDQLYVGGYFTHAGGVATNYVARWDGTNWHSISTDTFTGSFPVISAIDFYKDSLIVGGNFTAINGDTTMQRIAKYAQPLVNVQNLTVVNSIKLYPTLTQSTITLELSEAEKENTVIEIKNMLGQTLKSLRLQKGNTQLEIDVSSFAKGVYFVQVQSENKSFSKKFIRQ